MSADPGASAVATRRDSADRIAELGAAHVERVCEVSDRFFAEEAEAIAIACRDMALRFRDGGRLLVLANGPSSSDADHVAVEFVHPVIVGKRALPARAMDPGDLDAMSAVQKPQDIALGIAVDEAGAHARLVVDALERCATAGLLTIAMLGAATADDAHPEPTRAAGSSPPGHCFVIRTDDPMIVQEVQESLYHILWELVHVFLEAGGNRVGATS